MTDEQCEAQKKEMNDWNGQWSRGQAVLVRQEGKKEFESYTLYPAFMLYGKAVCHVLDNEDTIPLSELRAIEKCLHCKAQIVEPFPFETDKGEAVCDDCGQERNMH